MGKISGPQGQLYLMAQFEGANLNVLLAEPLPDGQPNVGSARRFVDFVLSQEGQAILNVAGFSTA